MSKSFWSENQGILCLSGDLDVYFLSTVYPLTLFCFLYPNLQVSKTIPDSPYSEFALPLLWAIDNTYSRMFFPPILHA